MPVYIPEDRTDRRERILSVVNHTGGSHHRAIVSDEHWYQAFTNKLMVLNVNDGRTVGEIEVMPWGSSGALVDMVLDGTTMWAVMDRTALVQVNISEPTQMVVGDVYTAQDLGIEPRHVCSAGGEIWVSGDGGVVRLRDGKRFLTGEPVTRVVQTPAGPAASVRRRIIMLEDGRYLGAATELQALPAGFGPDGGYLFVLQGDGGAHAGLMTPAFTETASVAIPGLLRGARVVGDRLALVTEVAIEFWKLKDGKLVEPVRVPLKGARDIALIKPNHYAIAGTFGRAMFRLEREGTDPGDTFYNVQREPGLLELAVTDRRRVLAGGREGFWLWKIGGEAELSDKTTDITSITPRTVDAAWGSATLIAELPKGASKGSEETRSVEFRHDGTTTRYSPDGSPRITALALVEGDVWIGHERGLDILRRMMVGVPLPTTEGAGAGTGTEPGSQAPPANGGQAGVPVEGAPMTFVPIHEYRFEGPVLFIFAERLGGGASMVSLHGGFALFRPTPVGEAPVFKNRGDLKN